MSNSATVTDNGVPTKVTVKGDKVIVATVGTIVIPGSGGGAVSSVNTRTGAVVLTAADVGLANANNTSDANKPISTATAAALAAKQPLDSDLTAIAAEDSSQTGVLATDGSGWFRKTYSALKTALGLTKSDVGLGNVDNTSDVSKPISTAQAAGLYAKMVRTAVKTANYTASANDLVPVDTTSGSITITLPTTPADGTLVAVKDIIQGGTNTVSVACGGSATYNRTGGGTTNTLYLLAESSLVQYSASGDIWTILAADKPLSQLDLRFLPRKSATVTSSATPTSNTDNTRTLTMASLAVAVTNMSTNQTGTPLDGDPLIWRITDNGTARAIAWGSLYESSGTATLPTTTVAGVMLSVGFIYNGVTSKWRCVAVA